MDRVKLQQISVIYWEKSAAWCCHSEKLYECFSSNATTWGNLNTQWTDWTEGLKSGEKQKLRDLQEEKLTIIELHEDCWEMIKKNVWHDLFKIIHYLKVIILKGNLAIELNTINMAFKYQSDSHVTTCAVKRL